MREDAHTEGLLRELAPQVLGVLVRRYGQFDACEDAVQEALVVAALQWPDQGLPQNPRGWLITVASRRMTDQVRSEAARRRREESVAAQEVPIDEPATPGLDGEPSGDHDDTLTLLFMCCHPALSEASQVALTLRVVGGLRTSEIARAFLVPEATMAQRISRAKRNIKASGVPFRMPPENERADRLRVVQHVLYLIFNEGYTASSGTELGRSELTAEAIRLTRALHQVLPDAGEQLTGHHRLDAVRAHLLEMAGNHAAARCCYRTAARRTTSLPERRYLEARAARLAEYEQNSALRSRPTTWRDERRGRRERQIGRDEQANRRAGRDAHP